MQTVVNMFKYNESYTESHTNIKNIKLEYKTHPKHQIIFPAFSFRYQHVEIGHSF